MDGTKGWKWSVLKVEGRAKVDGLEPNWTVIWAKVDGPGWYMAVQFDTWPSSFSSLDQRPSTLDLTLIMDESLTSNFGSSILTSKNQKSPCKPLVLDRYTSTWNSILHCRTIFHRCQSTGKSRERGHVRGVTWYFSREQCEMPKLQTDTNLKNSFLFIIGAKTNDWIGDVYPARFWISTVPFKVPFSLIQFHSKLFKSNQNETLINIDFEKTRIRSVVASHLSGPVFLQFNFANWKIYF